MRKKITFVVFSDASSKVNQITFSRMSIIFAGLLMTALLVFAGTMVLRYVTYNRTLSDNRSLRLNIANQLKEMEAQKQQIETFANDINVLKSRLLDLNQFEKKIRIIANIEKPGDDESLFGVGGSIPEDLNPSTSLENTMHRTLIREMHEQVGNLDDAAIKQHNGLESILKSLEEKRNILASTPSILPANGWISSRFGYRKSPFTNRREMHKGLDIAAPNKSPILATADGIVTFSGVKGLLGKVVIIDHGHGITTRYAHCSKVLKKSGDSVKRGEIIARIGSSGRSTGPHLHYEVRLNGVQVNPQRYILDFYAERNPKFKDS
ncbi:MAG: M23 family metallopeptidase [Desulfobacterales bacterium]